ncbi:MAG: Pr6Pr family membrane protein [Candidatus Izemoplasmatales bacterium]|jgi:hypothetical protein|nr:Pr6Pr family membrane protein [Candidatus Izemoplasmatales bacterium]NLF48603.1 Pr6Pr family membrane protein [Acholeplasmataceae bacterium]MDD4355255.1 Pr6Pr family membrane protein [Candidatus Izemoplasmatales bacterium]MDD4988208.1 Pr6Pr family membrane protein [Candidatus Izemoplasmatales bacterium]MDD5601903.1 Pr6Pr family membrane protein [Candidatus Izemoplasmatales bacterium]
MKKTDIKWIRLTFRLILIIGCLSGVLMNILFQKNLIRSLSYFTVQSNLFVLAIITIETLRKAPPGKLFMMVKTGVLMAIMTTFVIYHLVLWPTLSVTPEYDFPFHIDFLVHTFTPIMMLVDYFLFSPKGLLRTREIWAVLVIPVLYLLYINLYAALGGTFEFAGEINRYPYYFLDIDRIGFWTSFGYISLLAGLLLIGGVGLYSLDWRLGKISQHIVDGKGSENTE